MLLHKWRRVAPAKVHGAWAVALSLSVLFIGACTRANPAADFASLRARGAVIEVRNEEFEDVVVYLIRSGTPIPLGTVPGLSRRALRVGEGQLGNGGGIALAVGIRGASIHRVSTVFDLPPGRMAAWVVRAVGANEQPVVR